MSSTTQGMWMSLSGYNDKMGVLAKHILERIRGLVVDPARLEVIKEQLKRDWENFFLGQSYKISDYYGKHLLADKQWLITEKLPEVSCKLASCLGFAMS
jgi:insulysin